MRLDVLVIDLRVLGNAAWDHLDSLHREAPGLPVVVCCGPSTVAQRVRGLRMGADDWLSKPCHPEELIARVEAVVRRRARSKPGSGQGFDGRSGPGHRRRQRRPGRWGFAKGRGFHADRGCGGQGPGIVVSVWW